MSSHTLPKVFERSGILWLDALSAKHMNSWSSVGASVAAFGHFAKCYAQGQLPVAQARPHLERPRKNRNSFCKDAGETLRVSLSVRLCLRQAIARTMRSLPVTAHGRHASRASGGSRALRAQNALCCDLTGGNATNATSMIQLIQLIGLSTE
eukprot:s1444_g14.t1